MIGRYGRPDKRRREPAWQGGHGLGEICVIMPLQRRHVFAATIGNALECYDFIIYALFAPDWSQLLPAAERLRQADAVTRHLRRRLRDAPDRGGRDRCVRSWWSRG